MAGSLDCRREYSRTHMTKHIGRGYAVGNLDSLVIKKIDTLIVVAMNSGNQIQAINSPDLSAYEPVRQTLMSPSAPADSERIRVDCFISSEPAIRARVLFSSRNWCRTRHRKTLKKVDCSDGCDLSTPSARQSAPVIWARMTDLRMDCRYGSFSMSQMIPGQLYNIGMDL